MFWKRLPFEMAEPGVDPTKQYNPLPRHKKGNLKDVLPWVIGLILFAAVGYQKFIGPRIETQAAQKAAKPAATATAVRPALLSDVNNKDTPPTATSTLTPTATVTPTATLPPTPTPLPANIVPFGVFEDGQQIACWCNADTGEVGGDDPDKCRASPPSMCKGNE